MTLRECFIEIGKKKGYSDEEIQYLISNYSDQSLLDKDYPLKFCNMIIKKFPDKKKFQK